MIKTTKQVTIFEGPDGGGKTRAAKAYAKATGAVYTHFSNLPEIGFGLARTYVEAMLPALLGYQDVVLDRAWMSEVPYGEAFRAGDNRVGLTGARMLDRLAMRCGGAMVLCLPAWEVVQETFNRRRQDEMLDSDAQLKQVYHIYNHRRLTTLPTLLYDYKNSDFALSDASILKSIRMTRHALEVRSAGNLNATVMLVGENFANHKADDPYYQWPFASFSALGCSHWLTAQLEDADISEQDLLWVNADQLQPRTFELELWTHVLRPRTIIALGSEAGRKLTMMDVDHVLEKHPQFWRRFHAAESYSLINTIKEVL